MSSSGRATAAVPAQAGDHNYLAWTADPLTCGLPALLITNGLLYVARLKLPNSATVTNLHVYVTTAGSVLTANRSFAALFSSSRGLLSQTADQSTAWGSAGLATMALTASQSVGAGFVWVGVWSTGVALPTLAAGTTLAAGLSNAGLTAPNLRFATADTGLTTTAPATIGSQTGSALAIWAALS